MDTAPLDTDTACEGSQYWTLFTEKLEKVSSHKQVDLQSHNRKNGLPFVVSFWRVSGSVSLMICLANHQRSNGKSNNRRWDSSKKSFLSSWITYYTKTLQTYATANTQLIIKKLNFPYAVLRLPAAEWDGMLITRWPKIS